MFSFFRLSLKARIITIALVVILGAGFTIYNKKLNRNYIQSPHVGDVYTVKLKGFMSEGFKESYPYGLLKIEAISGDDVAFNVASAQFGTARSANKSLHRNGKKSDFYSGVVLHVPNAKLASLLEAGDIVNVDR